MTDVLAVIPARGGSKGIPGKNMVDLGGRPLLDWTVQAALAAAVVDEVLVTSDDDDVLTLAAGRGVTAHRRPAHLARDEVHAVHAVLEVVAGRTGSTRPRTVVMVLPTSPFRRPQDIDGAVDLLASTGAPSVISVVPLDKQLVHLRSIGPDGSLQAFVDQSRVNAQRQDQPPLYGLNGSVYAMAADDFLAAGTFHVPGARPWVMTPDTSVDINEPADLERARRMLADRAEAYA
jgi:CMP-N,N'-diacetyllegionaminic acid synthase